MEESYSCPDCTFTADRDLVLEVLKHFFNCTSFRCIQDITCGHSLGPSTSSPQTQLENNNSTQNNSCHGGKSTNEMRDSLVQSGFVAANVSAENTTSLYSPHSNTSTTSSSRTTNDFIFQSVNSNRSNVRENFTNKDASPMDVLEHCSEEILDEQFNTDTSIENMQSETGRDVTLNSQDKQTVTCKVESYFSLKPDYNAPSIVCPSRESIASEKNGYGSAAVSTQGLRMEKFHDSVPTDTASSDTLMQVHVKVEPNSDEYDHYNTAAGGLLGGSSTEGLHRQNSILTAVPAIPSAVGSSCWDSIQQLQRDAVSTDALTGAAGEGMSANSKVLHSGQQVQCTPAAQVTRCPVCRIAYKDRRALTTHLKLQHPNHTNNTFQCKECNKTFGYKRNLLVHMKEQHLEAGQEFPCYECQKMYKTKRALKEHLRTHTNHKKYVCDMCGKCLKTMSGLKGHYVHIHNRYY